MHPRIEAKRAFQARKPKLPNKALELVLALVYSLIVFLFIVLLVLAWSYPHASQ